MFLLNTISKKDMSKRSKKEQRYAWNDTLKLSTAYRYLCRLRDSINVHGHVFTEKTEDTKILYHNLVSM